MQAIEDALYDYLAGDAILLGELEGPAEERILAVRPPLVEVFPSIVFDSVNSPVWSQSNPMDDRTLELDIAARTRPKMNAIAARIVDQLHIVQQRRPDQRVFVIPGRRLRFQQFIDVAGVNTYDATPRDVFHKVLSFRVITTTE